MKKFLNSDTGSSTVECAILIPVILASVLLCVFIFIILYEKTLLQSYADEMAMSLAREWGYKALPVDELESGVYKKETYENREIYWHLKLWENSQKELTAFGYIKDNAKSTGILKPYKDHTGKEEEKEIIVDFRPGIPSVIHITITGKYTTPAEPLLKLIGLNDYLILEAKAKSNVYDTKDMINTTDYVYQLVRETETFKKFTEKIKPLKEKLDDLVKE
jgi:hypothetical protein